jgi:hypothetical protein
MKDYITLERLGGILESIGNIAVDSEPEETNVQFDPNVYDQFVVDPKNVDPAIIGQIADLFDGSLSGTIDNAAPAQDGPTTTEKILNAVALIYLTKNGQIVGAATVSDPTQENYRGIVPADYYEMKIGQSLSGKLQQDFFAISPEFHDKGLAQELRKLIHTVADSTFVTVPVTDVDTIEGLAKAGYNKISTFETGWDTTPVTLWIDTTNTQETK